MLSPRESNLFGAEAGESVKLGDVVAASRAFDDDEMLGLVALSLRMAAERGGVAIAIAGVDPEDGASSVARELAARLGDSDAGEVILLTPSATAATIREMSATVSDAVTEPGRFRVVAIDGPSRRALLEGHMPVGAAVGEAASVVVVDVGPLMGSVDASLLARACDTAVIVTASGEASMARLRDARRALDEVSVPIAGVVVQKRHHHVPRWLARLVGLPAAPRRKQQSALRFGTIAAFALGTAALVMGWVWLAGIV